jgi:hypothetical protein
MVIPSPRGTSASLKPWVDEQLRGACPLGHVLLVLLLALALLLPLSCPAHVTTAAMSVASRR